MTHRLWAVPLSIIAAASSAFSEPAEVLWRRAAESFHRTALPAPQPPAVPVPGDEEPADLPQFESYPEIVKPDLRSIEPQAIGPLLGSFVLAQRLDIHRALMPRQLGPSMWDVSAASDKDFKVLYLTFQRPGRFLLKRIDDLNRLRKDGVVVTLDPGVSYRFKVSVNIFNPVRGSTLRIDPANGTRGPAHKMKTGEFLDLVKGKSFVFSTGGKELWLLYGTDVDPRTDTLAPTRSLLFIHENGMDSKAWPVGEDRLTPDRPLGVGLDGTWLTVIKGSDGRLRVHAGTP